MIDDPPVLDSEIEPVPLFDETPVYDIKLEVADGQLIDCSDLNALTPMQLELARAKLKELGGGKPDGLEIKELSLLVAIQRKLRRTASAGAPGRAKKAKKPAVDVLGSGAIPKL